MQCLFQSVFFKNKAASKNKTAHKSMFLSHFQDGQGIFFTKRSKGICSAYGVNTKSTKNFWQQTKNKFIAIVTPLIQA
jgi:hypothetical protein